MLIVLKCLNNVTIMPNASYDLFLKIFMTLFDKAFPFKRKK